MAHTLAAPAHSELLIKKSRFIACVQPMADRPSAQAAIAALRALHPGAAHVCWALLAGGHSAAVDDGEPGGTAGRPMLEVLRHQDLEQVLASVVRYYGGIRLGAGGLVRAYSDSVTHALAGASRVPIVRLKRLRCQIPYALEGTVRRALDRAGAQSLTVTHATLVDIGFAIAEPEAPRLQSELDQASHGRAVWLDASD